MGDAVMETRRTGFGPYVFLALPFAVAGLGRWRDRILTSPLAPIAVVVALHYALWFFTGSSQRLRHLLPVYPMVVLCVTVAAAGISDRAAFRRPLVGAVAFAIALQLAGQAIFTVNAGRYWIFGESRDAFLERNVTGYGLVSWLNANLTGDDRVLVAQRQLLYLIERPVFFGHPAQQALVDLTPGATDPARFYAQLRGLGITHVAVLPGAPQSSALARLTRRLSELACARTVKRIDARSFQSRTLPSLAAAVARFDIVALAPDTCLLP
jgi:hypothetical protein